MIVVGAFVIALAGLGMVGFQQVEEQDQLNKQFDVSQSQLGGIQLAPLSSQQVELEERLSQATSQLEAAKGILRQSASSVAAAATLFEVAETYGLVITELTSPGVAGENLEGAPLSVISLTVKVDGDVPDLVDFVTTLNRLFTTGVVKSVTITIPDEASGDNISASVHLAVYTYRGD